MQESKLRLYSLGIVVEDKPPETDIILVSPIEVLNIQQPGSIKEYQKTSKGTLKGVHNNDFKTEHKATNYLRAKWISFGQSNRITAPDVVANETVILFKYENVDEYYWTTIFREPELRRLETVHYAYSNLSSGKTQKAFDKKTSYWVDIDTRNKYIQLHTAMNDGEYTEYDITIDTKKGYLEIKDKKGNYIKLDSTKDVVTVNTLKTVNVVAGQSVTITTPTVFINGNVEVKGNIHATGTIIDDSGNTNHHSH